MHISSAIMKLLKPSWVTHGGEFALKYVSYKIMCINYRPEFWRKIGGHPKRRASKIRTRDAGINKDAL